MLAKKKPLGSLAFLALGVASALIGLLPWLITGMRLPLQNLWAADTLPPDMPIAFLPFSQYYLSLLAALLVIGSAVAGVVGRSVPAKHPRSALWALLGGVAIVQVIATVQAAVTVGGGLDGRTASTFYLAAIVAGSIFSTVVGLGMLALIARAPKPAALVALSVAAVAFSSWLSGLVYPVGTIPTSSDFTNIMGEIIRLAPALLIGGAIVWCGVDSAGKVIAIISSLVVLWLGPTLITAISAAAGTRVLAPYPAEMLEYGLGVFRSVLGIPELWAIPVGVAVAIALIGLAAQRTARAKLR